MSVSQRRCFVIAIGLGLLYLVLLPFKPYPLGWPLKPLPMLLFALLVWRAFPGAPGRWLALGYGAAAAGDFFLDFGDRDGLFIQALLAFLVNQIAFAVAFVALGRGRSWSWPRVAPVLVYGLTVGAWLLPAAGTLQVPVAIYLGCLLLMALLATRLEAKPGPLWLGGHAVRGGGFADRGEHVRPAVPACRAGDRLLLLQRPGADRLGAVASQGSGSHCGHQSGACRDSWLM